MNYDDMVGDAVDNAVDESMIERRTVIPVRVKKFDYKKNTVDVEVIAKEWLGDKPKKIAKLKEVPILMMGNKEIFFTFPIKKGDEGIIIVADRSIDEHEKGLKEIRDNRHMDISDGMFIPLYLRPKKERIKKWQKDKLIIRAKCCDDLALILDPKEKSISTRFEKDKITTEFKKDSIKLMTNSEKTKIEINKENVKVTINNDLKFEIKDSEIIFHEKVRFNEKVTVVKELQANVKVDLNGAVAINGTIQVGS